MATAAAKIWLDRLKEAEKTCLIQDGKRKVHYKFAEGQEMVEEYSMTTEVLLRRAWKKKTEFGGEGVWEVEVGDPEPQLYALESLGIKESNSNPFVSRRITKTALEWRIRNLPYPLATYLITAEPQQNCITVRTTNKKYFKKLSVPDLERLGLRLEQENLEFNHKNNTLIITYKKPSELIRLEKTLLEELKELKASKEGDVDCNPS